MTKIQDTNNDILLSKISQIDFDINAYENAIIDNHGKDPLPQETIDFYQNQINELILMKSQLEKI